MVFIRTRGENKRAPLGLSPKELRSTLFHLPLLDELRTFCYEHKVEEMPAFLGVG
jgi:hypothetical protein